MARRSSRCDTDGIYFVAPDSRLRTRVRLRRCSTAVAAAMPDGIKLEIDGRYPAMFSYKMKNYVLIDEAGETDDSRFGPQVARTGTLPAPFHGGHLPAAARRSARRDRAAVGDYRRKIEHHEFGIADLMKTETLQDSLEVYRQKIAGKRRNPAPPTNWR